jgi:hypothetical protein
VQSGAMIVDHPTRTTERVIPRLRYTPGGHSEGEERLGTDVGSSEFGDEGIDRRRLP